MSLFRYIPHVNSISKAHWVFQKFSPQFRGCGPPVYASRNLQPRRHYASSFYFDVPSPTTDIESLNSSNIGQDVIVHGYLGSRRDTTKRLSFCPLYNKSLNRSVQLTSKPQGESSSVHLIFKRLQRHIPVVAQGIVQSKAKPKGKPRSLAAERNDEIEVVVSDIRPLNDFPEQRLLQVSNIPPQFRHLQLRQSSEIRSALHFRSQVSHHLRNVLINDNFVEVETPLLFKSTPEGAREFLVPTRRKGEAYALPQSPQQYKQILMASGIPKYFQIAKCFRDEDLRADRQPEFTQMDLEIAFASSKEVMACIETLMKNLWKQLLSYDLGMKAFTRMSYEEAMSKYGSDKPDTRLGMEIRGIGHMLPVDLTSKISPHSDPLVDVFKLTLNEPAETRDFITKFMDSPVAEPYRSNLDGQPGIFVYNSRQPLGGLMPLGFEAAEQLEEMLQLEEGDLVVIQARENKPFSGGTTMLGSLRRDLHRAAVVEELLDPPAGWNFLWVNEFPLFTPTKRTSDPGQHGRAGIASTHHPFTSPATLSDLDLLHTEPLSAKADHYDLVLNGIELGGGSRRIHDSRLQEHILRDVLKMPDERLVDFDHLLRVLKAGCPPHAGIALGFDRLVATMLGKESIRDVIAFPKSGKGEDLLVSCPSRMTERQLDTYHLSIKE